MNFDRLATDADLFHLDLDRTIDDAAAPPHAPITGWHALDGITLGHLRGLAPGTDVPVAVERVLEETDDLAVADRVAFVMSSRTGMPHVVLAAADGYLVARVGPALDWAAAMRLVPAAHMPRIFSVACDEGVLPVLLPMPALAS